VGRKGSNVIVSPNLSSSIVIIIVEHCQYQASHRDAEVVQQGEDGK